MKRPSSSLVNLDRRPSFCVVESAWTRKVAVASGSCGVPRPSLVPYVTVTGGGTVMVRATLVRYGLALVISTWLTGALLALAQPTSLAPNVIAASRETSVIRNQL